MAILTRRALQSLIHDYPTIPSGLGKIVGRLNLGTKESLDAEWELIVLSALSKVGVVEYEPDLGGSSNVDFRFRDPSGLVATGDITSISDDEVNRRNPVDHFNRELYRRTSERRLEGGSFSIGISSEIWGKRSRKDEVLLRLPSPDRFKHSIFDAAFEAFLERIASAPSSPQQHNVENAEASLVISYNPGSRFSVLHHADYRSPRDIVRNTLYNRLKKKVDQVKKAGPVPGTGFRGILICDGGSAILQSTVGIGVYGFDQIARHFLRKTQSIDFVAAIVVRDPLSWSSSRDERYQFDLKIVEHRGRGVESTFGALLRQGLHQLPPPTRTPINAKSQLEWHASHGETSLNYGDQSGWTLSDGKFALSCRAVIDYITGRIDRNRFEILTDAWGLSILKRALDAGALVNSIQLLHHPNDDDDELMLSWKTKDESVSPFVKPNTLER